MVTTSLGFHVNHFRKNTSTLKGLINYLNTSSQRPTYVGTYIPINVEMQKQVFLSQLFPNFVSSLAAYIVSQNQLYIETDFVLLFAHPPVYVETTNLQFRQDQLLCHV